MADDLAGALDALGSASRRDLLDAILDTQEPTILAELCTHAAPDRRGDIERRLWVLTPEAAAEIAFLASARARVEALLSAGLVDAAEAHERQRVPERKIAGRDLAAFKADHPVGGACRSTPLVLWFRR